MKKLKAISLLCSLVMILGCFSGFSAFADGEPAVWKTSDGAGTAGTTYALNQSNFQSFWETNKQNDLVGNFILTEDVTVNAAWDSSIGVTLKGTFDGNGKTVSGIVMTDSGNVGLFEFVEGVVKNLRIVNSYFVNTATTTTDNKGTGSIAAIVRNGGTVINCYSEAVIAGTATAAARDLNFGGIVGMIGGCTAVADGEAKQTNTVSNCVFAGDIIEGSGRTGGILGYVNGQNTAGAVMISDCLNLGSVSSLHWFVGAVIGQVQDADLSVVKIQNILNLSSDVSNDKGSNGPKPSLFYGYGYAASLSVTNALVPKGIIMQHALEGEERRICYEYAPNGAPHWGMREPTIAEILSADMVGENGYLKGWSLAAGNVPDPIIEDAAKGLIDHTNISLGAMLNAELIGLATDTATVRVSNSNAGLRFETTINNREMLAYLEAAGATVTMSTYITAAKYFEGDNALTEFSKSALDGASKKYINVAATQYLRTNREDGHTAFAGSVVNIKDKSMDYVGVGCITVTIGGQSYDIYAEPEFAVSVSDVATVAAEDVKTAKEDGYSNSITDVNGTKVYSPYTQAQYDCIKSLIVAA